MSSLKHANAAEPAVESGSEPPSQLCRIVSLAVLAQMLFNQPVDTEALQLGAQNQDLIRTQGMFFVDDLQDFLQGRIELRIEADTVVGW
jgi:hypothetical protein